MDDAREWLRRLQAATNRHEAEAVAACFAEGYVCEAPAHPSRSFTGRDQVRRNWEQIFAFVPDIRAEVVACAVEGPTIWTQWEMDGTRRDGSRHRMAGVIVFEMESGVAQRAAFFLEPVEESAADMDTAVHAQVAR